MQKSTQMISAVINNLWQILNRTRSVESISDALTTVLLHLYCYHKRYGLYDFHKECSIYPDYDFLCGDLETSILESEAYSKLKNEKLNRELRYFIDSISEEGITPEDFNTIYVDVLRWLFELACIHAGRKEGDFLTPYAITKLMAYFVKKNGCSSVYDPFCGAASIVHELSSNGEVVRFEGQDLNHKASLYARVNAEAVYGDDSCIRVGDSFRDWNGQKFDAVVSCPPFAMRLSPNQIESLGDNNIQFPCRTIDDLLFLRSFAINQSAMTVTLHPTGFCFKGGHERELKKYLVDNNLLDMIIALPANILYGTSIPCVLVICKQGRDNSAPITFVNAQDYFLEQKKDRTFDYQRFISMIEGDKHDCVYVNREEVANYDYNLAPELYQSEQIELKDGQRLVNLGDVLKMVALKPTETPVVDVVSTSCLSSDFISVLRNKDMTVKPNQVGKSNIYCTLQTGGKTYLLTSSISVGNLKKYGIYTNDEILQCSPTIQAFEVNDSLVTPEYIVYILLNNKVITQSSMPLSGFMNLPIVIDNMEKQKMIVEEVVNRYYEQVKAEQEADAKRLGVKQNISDLEHMLGPTRLRIDKIISRLEKASYYSDQMSQLVKSLKDNVDYQNRIIQFSNSQIDSESFNLKQCDIVKFIETYSDSWRNYGGPYFDLQVCDKAEDDILVNGDTTMLTVMFDSILSNAARHGFHKNRNHTSHNVLQISTSLVLYNDNPYVCLSFANNGDPIPDGFTIRDYISKGRYSASTGRSGLGGYHVYRIAKGHNGYIYLDSNKMWNVVVEVLLPICSPANQNFSEYEHECI